MRRRAFSLVEVAIALGIVSFVIIAILGLFPIGFKNAQESRRETRASYIAEQIVKDIQSPASTNVRVFYGSTPPLSSLRLNLAMGGTNVFGCDSANRLSVLLGAEEYKNVNNDSSLDFLVQIAVTPALAFSNLARLDVEVSAPAAAPLASRSRYYFTTLVRAP